MAREQDYHMSHSERRATSILVVDRDLSDLETLRSVLINAGYGFCQVSSDHNAAIKLIYEKNFSHILFTAQSTSIPVKDFLHKAMQIDSGCIAIATSNQPQVDEVFELLKIGARGFLAKPFNVNSVDEAIVFATKGEPFSRVILEARDRNEAFAALLAATLDKFAEISRHARNHSSAEDLVLRYAHEFRSSTRLARVFAKDGEKALLEKLQEFFISLGNGPATRLGRLRKRLAVKRMSDESGDS